MKQEKTTPEWIVELKKTLKKEKAAQTRVEKVPKIPKSRKKKRHRIKPDKNVQRFSDKNRTKMTPGEIGMASILEDAGINFKSQFVIGKRIADFVIPNKRLVIEVDGEYHFFNGRKDAIRTKALREAGYTVVRFTNHAVLNDAPNVKNDLLLLCIGSHAVLHVD